MNQMLSILIAVVLLGIASLGINSLLIDKTRTMLEAEASLSAVSIAQTMIDEIMRKSFDAATATGTRVYDSTKFTAPNALGPSASEKSHVAAIDTVNASDRWFNDVDDYDLYKRISSTPVLGKFSVLDSVYYVTETDPDARSGYQTNFKKVVITVTHPNMSYPLILSDVVVYRKYF